MIWRLTSAIPALAAAVIALTAGAVYLSLIARHGDLRAPVVWLMSGYIVGGGALSIASAVLRSRRTYCLAAAAGMFSFAGSAGLFMIGTPLLIAAALAAIATVPASRVEHASAAGAAGIAALMMLVGSGGLVGLIVLARWR